MCSEGSVTGWIAELKAGDEAAAYSLWERYFPRLVGLCRKKLEDHSRRVADEEDVALSAFDSFCRRAKADQLSQLRDRDNLWPLLAKIAWRKAIDQMKHDARKKRGDGRVQGESAIAADQTSTGQWGVDQVVGDEPTPEMAAVMIEEFEQLMERLGDEKLRATAQMKLEGYTSQEIAKRLGCSPRTVARKLWRIRTVWSAQDFDDE